MVCCGFQPLSDQPPNTRSVGTQDARRQLLRDWQRKETTMRKTILIILAASLMAASSTQFAAAAEHHQARKVHLAPASERFRNANNMVPAPAQPNSYSDWSNFSEAHINAVGR